MDKKCCFELNGIRCVVKKDFVNNGKRTNESWVLSGYEVYGSGQGTTGSVNAERTKYRYTPEYSYLRKQVGAVVAQLGSIDNRQDVSSEKIVAAKKMIADEKQQQAKEEVLDIKEAAAKNNQQLGADENNPVQRNSSIPHPPKNASAKEGEPLALRVEREVKHDGEYVLTSRGSKDFGEITQEIANSIGGQAGKIRLRRGIEHERDKKGGYGEKHIERDGRK